MPLLSLGLTAGQGGQGFGLLLAFLAAGGRHITVTGRVELSVVNSRNVVHHPACIQIS